MSKLAEIRKQLEQNKNSWLKRNDNGIHVIKQHNGFYYKTKSPRYDVYSAYIKSDEWKAKRLAHMTRNKKSYGWKCQACKFKHKQSYKFHLHHITYKRFTKENMQNDVKRLCEQCHDHIHKIARKHGIGMAYGRMASPTQGHINLYNISKEYVIIKKKLTHHKKIPKKLQGWAKLLEMM